MTLQRNHIIAFGGYKHAGKSTIAKRLYYDLLEQGHSTKCLGFADPIRYSTACIFDMEVFSNKDAIDATLGVAPRDFMEWMGMGARERFGEDFWIKIMDKRTTTSTPTIFIIDDLRLPNEATWVKSKGGLTIRVNNPEQQEDSHLSTKDLDQIDFDHDVNNWRSFLDQPDDSVLDPIFEIVKKHIAND